MIVAKTYTNTWIYNQNMKKFKQLFKKQLIFLPLIAMVVISIGAFNYEMKQRSYKEISYDEFVKIAFKTESPNFEVMDNRWEITTPMGGKYFHQFSSYSDSMHFEELIRNHKESRVWILF